MTSPEEAPRVTEWVTTSDIAEGLGQSRQSIHLMMKQGLFESLHTIGRGERPMYVISVAEFDKMLASRKFPTPVSE